MLDHLFLERRAPAAWEPVCDIYETPDAVVVTVELPGLSRKDVDISCTENLLTITGRRPAVSLPSGSIVHQHERPLGAFQRSIVMPHPVDADQTSASMDAGVLTVTLPHRKPQQVSIRTESEESQPDQEPPDVPTDAEDTEET